MTAFSAFVLQRMCFVHCDMCAATHNVRSLRKYAHRHPAAQEADAARGGRDGGSSGSGPSRGGAEGGQLAHAAWRSLLDTWVPALLAECDFAASFLQLYHTPGDADAEGARRACRSKARGGVL